MILFRFKFFYSFLVQLSILGTCLLFTITKLLFSLSYMAVQKSYPMGSVVKML